MEGFHDYLNIADELDIMIFIDNNTSLTLKTVAYEVTSDKKIVISNPVKEGHLYPLENRYIYYFRFYKENMGMYLFKGTVVKRIKYDNLPAVEILLASPIKKIQRRRFFRVRFMSTGNFIYKRELSEQELARMKSKLAKKYKNIDDIVIEETVEEKIPFDTIDLSGGGIKVLCDNAYQIGDYVEGNFYIYKSWVNFKGEVTRNDKNESGKYEVGIKFLELDESTEAKIVSYVFEIERNIIKKGFDVDESKSISR